MPEPVSVFEGEAGSRLFSIDAGTPFLKRLAEGLLDVTGARDAPEKLSEALVFVPNRRSARQLAVELYDAVGGGVLMPPDIRPLGDAGDNDPGLFGELPEFDLKPPMPEGMRLGLLMQLVTKWYATRGEDLPMTAALAIATDLAALLDQAALSDTLDWSALETAYTEHDLAHHWQVSADFLKIISAEWPNILDEYGYSDPTAQELHAARALVARWERDPPQTPVIIAGSTGTTPASRLLMRAAITLPFGCVVFPGLDRNLEDQTLEAVRKAPSHPQYAFIQTLDFLNADVHSIRAWPYSPERTDGQMSRHSLIQESLAPAESTADWVERFSRRVDGDKASVQIREAFEGLTLIETENEAEEAQVIALIMREAVENEHQSIALITPDAGLGASVSSILRRWNLTVTPSAGQSLLETSAGEFVQVVINWWCDPGDPVRLLALLKHARFYMAGDAAFERSVMALERCILRGVRTWKTLDELIELIQYRLDNGDQQRGWKDSDADALLAVSSTLSTLQEAVDAVGPTAGDDESAAGIVEGLAALCDRLSGGLAAATPLWAGSDGSMVARCLEEFASLVRWSGVSASADIRSLFERFAANKMVAEDEAPHPRLFIWGPLEARLQSCDRFILAGLNEGQWPSPSSGDGLLPRVVRTKVGLPDPDARIGLSAHDFAQLACAPDVILTRSKRLDEKPSVASRWLWRLRILASSALESLEVTDELLSQAGEHYLQIARAQFAPASVATVQPPRPKPAVSERPLKVNVTDVGTLIRDPYGYYAKTILKLRPLDAIDAEPDARIEGTAIHGIIEDVIKAGPPYPTPEVCVDRMIKAVRGVGGLERRVEERRPIWTEATAQFLDWLEGQTSHTLASEVKLKATLAVQSAIVSLEGRADLVIVESGGRFHVVDHKTGQIPTDSQVASGLEPQLALLAALIEQADGRVEAISEARQAAALIYTGFGTSAGAQVRAGPGSKNDVRTAVNDTWDGFSDLMRGFLQDDTPYLARPRVAFKSKSTDYDRLSRYAEWDDPGHEGGDA